MSASIRIAAEDVRASSVPLTAAEALFSAALESRRQSRLAQLRDNGVPEDDAEELAGSADLATALTVIAAAEQASKIAGVSKVIVADDPRWGRPYIVDLQRVEQRFPPRQRWLVKDLAALLHSLPPNVSRTDQLRFLMVYLGKLRVDPLVRRWAGEIAAKQQRMARHTPKYP